MLFSPSRAISLGSSAAAISGATSSTDLLRVRVRDRVRVRVRVRVRDRVRHP